MAQPVDFYQRQRALDPRQSFICEAPAGSGKTELLTQRVLTLLARVAQPEAILAITFTRKAAAEMRERILSALQRGLGAEPTEDHGKTTWALARAALEVDARLDWNLLQNPNRLQIRTFDSLCAFLNQTLPLQASLGININPAEDAEVLYQKAVKNVLLTLEQDVPWAETLGFILAHLDNNQNKLITLLVTMLKARDSWIPVLQSSLARDNIRELLQAQLQEVLDEKITQLLRYFAASVQPAILQQKLFESAGFAAANLHREQVVSDIVALHHIDLLQLWPGADADGLRQWRGIRQLLLTQTGSFRTKLDKRCGFPPGTTKEEKVVAKQKKEALIQLLVQLAEIPGLHPALVEIDYWPTPHYTDQQWPVLEQLMRLLPVVLAHLRLVFAQAQEVDFIEVSERARDALGDEHAPTELALRLDQRIEHILVDEFQDTSFGQVELLAKLTLGWQRGDGRTLFCVGDAMQSIYGFRGAKVGLFLHCKAKGLADVPLEPLQLKSNFRSQGKMVRWINQTFAQAFPAQSDIAAGAVAFAEADAFRPELEGEPAILYLSDRGTDGRAESDQIVTIIRQAWLQNDQASIAILVRNRAHAARTAAACRNAGLRYRALDLIPLADLPAVQDILTLCVALLDPLDRIAWFALLRAPWCGLTLDDLLCLSPENGYPESQPLLEVMADQLDPNSVRRRALSTDGGARLNRVYPVLRCALDQRQRLPLRQWVEGVWLALGGPVCMEDSGDLDNITRVWQMLERLSAAGELPDAEQLQQAVAELYSAPDPQADERLQIMTIHKSKGLEFDVVILPDLHRAPRTKESELLIWSERVGRDGQEHWLLAPIHATGSDKDAIYRFVQREQKKREQFEACRLLYVASTRAKQTLHLFAEAGRDPETRQWQSPANGSLLSYIWPSLANPIVSLTDEAVSLDLADSEPAARTLARLANTWAGPEYAKAHLLDDYILPFDYHNASNNLLFAPAPPINAAALVGTFVHELLQLMVSQGAATWAGRDLEPALPAWRHSLMMRGAAPEALEQYLENIANCVRTVLGHTQFQQTLQRARRIFTEYAIKQVAADARQSQHFIVDLLCDMGGGQAVIVDYKTSRPKPGQSLADFFQQEQSHYAEIMDSYREAIHHLGFASVTSVLFFVMIGAWYELTDDP